MIYNFKNDTLFFNRSLVEATQLKKTFSHNLESLTLNGGAFLFLSIFIYFFNFYINKSTNSLLLTLHNVLMDK